MKLKINKACDLSSISVLPPPQPRRPNTAAASGLKASQLRSQPSQQSFSQGLSSQHGMFSHFSQSSFDEVLTNEQRFASQERENSAKKFSCVPAINYTQEESQMPLSRSSANLMRKWNPASLSDHRCQISEELEHRIGLIETSLNRFGMILDSVQSDVMQVNKGTKEVLLETEGLRQKLNAQETSLQLMGKGQEDIKASVEGGLKSVSDQMSTDTYQDKLQEIFLVVSSLPNQFGASLMKLQNELCNTFIKEIQAMSPSHKTANHEVSVSSVLPPKGTGCCTAPQRKGQNIKKSPAAPPKLRDKATLVPKKETGSWNEIKLEENNTADKASYKEHRRKASVFEQERVCSVMIESDEEIDEAFSCLLHEKQTDFANCLVEDTKEETEKILRRARRRKRKYRNTIIIN